jgi:isopentenyl diphosphate isomerase/L-lactate dehydrogenase-like FMN-dependent dehydrogenase
VSEVLTDDPPASALELVSLSDYERAAEGLLDPGAWAYYAGGAGDEVTMRDNVDAWGRLAICPRVLVGVGQRDPSVTILGRPRPHPLIIAPMAVQRLAHREAEVATARAAAATGAVMCLSTFGSTSLSDLAAAVPDAARWFQLYVFKDRGRSRELVARALDHGYEALVVTADLPVLGVRERELRSPVASVVPSAQALSGHAPAVQGGHGEVSSADLAGLVDPDLTWSDVERFAADCALPVIVKGILGAADARRAAEHGARAVVVSNHGGRQLDTVLSGADALPAIVDAVGDRLDVLVDGGIRRGTDVLKALALGARAVMIGRPLLWGLIVDGSDGARRVLEILLSELDAALALAGAPRARELDRTFVTPRSWASQTS